MSPDAGRECTACHAFKTWDQFFRQPRGKNGRRANCKACDASRHVSYVAANRDKVNAKRRQSQAAPEVRARLAQRQREKRRQDPERFRDHDRKKLYGISRAEWERLLQEQGGRCAVCFREAPLAVDHCHKTGKVRGLLCRSCNCAIGLFHEDTERMAQAVTYLRTRGLRDVG